MRLCNIYQHCAALTILKFDIHTWGCMEDLLNVPLQAQAIIGLDSDNYSNLLNLQCARYDSIVNHYSNEAEFDIKSVCVDFSGA